MAQKEKKAKKFVQIAEKSLNNSNKINIIKNHFNRVVFYFNKFLITAQNSIVGGENMIIANIIASILVIIGAINWGLVGIFNWNLVTAIFGAGLPVGAVIIYVLILISAIWLIIACVMQRGRISYRRDY